MYKIMTPGPTQVCENVRMARSRICTNPDIDVEFVEFYKKTCEHISSLLYTSNETLILDGEGILGLEAACATLTEPGDKVLRKLGVDLKARLDTTFINNLELY